MSFEPILPVGGYVGWRFLQRTLPQQQEAHAADRSAERDADYFRERIAGITSAGDLVADRRLLSVALTAFGLQDDLPNRAFVQTVLESPAGESGSFVNRLADKRYKALNAAFGFGDTLVSWNQFDGFAEPLLEQFRARRFEAAVGTQDESMRLALALQRDLKALAEQEVTETTRWFTVLGTPSLRQVFETAFNLPSAFGALDLDRQADVLQEKLRGLTGEASVAQFAGQEPMEALIRRFFLAEQVQAIPSASAGAGVALQLLQQGQASLGAALGR